MTASSLDPRALLAKSRLGVLATIKADGCPQLSPVQPFYDEAAGVVHVSTGAGAAKAANLRRGPRVTLEATGSDAMSPRSWPTGAKRSWPSDAARATTPAAMVRLEYTSGPVAAASHAEAAERLAATTEAPLVPVLTAWFRARGTAARSVLPGGPTATTAAARYRAAEEGLRAAGMPGLLHGLLPLALLGLRLLHDRPAPTDPNLDRGPYRPWARPPVLLAEDRREEARAALAAAPDPPRDHPQEPLWCLIARAAPYAATSRRPPHAPGPGADLDRARRVIGVPLRPSCSAT